MCLLRLLHAGWPWVVSTVPSNCLAPPPRTRTLRTMLHRRIAMAAAAGNATSISLQGRMRHAAGPAEAAATAAAAPRLKHLHIGLDAGESLPAELCLAFMRAAACRLVSLAALNAVGCWGVAECAALAGCSRLMRLSLGVRSVREGNGGGGRGGGQRVPTGGSITCDSVFGVNGIYHCN